MNENRRAIALLEPDNTKQKDTSKLSYFKDDAKTTCNRLIRFNWL
jgi:hypothetical protein